MTRVKALIPIIGTVATISTATPFIVSCSKPKPEPEPAVTHNIVAKNLTNETSSLFDINCSKETYTDDDVREGLELAFTLSSKGVEVLENYAFVYWDVIIKTSSGQSTYLSTGFTWKIDPANDYIWHLEFEKTEDIVNKLTSDVDLQINFRVQNYLELPVLVYDQHNNEFTDTNVTPASINLIEFVETQDQTITLSGGTTQFNIQKVSVWAKSGWHDFGLAREYNLETHSRTSYSLIFTSTGIQTLLNYWYAEEFEIIKIQVVTH